MSMLMPTSMPMPMSRYRCRDFQMAGKDTVLSFCYQLNLYEIYGKHILNICKYIKYIKCMFTLYVKCLTTNFKWGFTCGKEIHQAGIFNSSRDLIGSNQPYEITLLSTTLFYIYKTLRKAQFIALSLIFTSIYMKLS